ncbi:spore germination protein [Clostridium tetani]|uniref:Spore germination protein KA n=1 Tax=Clostridium tetani (strain Massachusetts / E88) TaxID=212717 RepID=Q892K0_CLOTE|nr:spore germination protein [Clostridium tetani]AAO36595.1 spore germination protein KA [Clostridium tetani E88]AVP54073.1 spore germination protein [Clostridium tetani]KGI39078.1 spore gernimation protein KA [Clostridium tetani]KGI39355.1 spore gernimation protein KA [Clostridium tetani ATCC 9441]KGI43647.1 spore gernimation protein KA [Clostridium tetani]
MANYLKKLLSSKKNKSNNISEDNTKEYVIKKSLKENIELFKNNIFPGDNTIIYRQFKNKNSQLKFCVIFIDGMVNTEIINENILPQLMNTTVNSKSKNLINCIKEEVLIVNEVKESNRLEDILSSLLMGKSILFIDGFEKVLILNTIQWEKRSIEEPQGESVVKGPREGFNESLITNISLIRRRIKSQELKLQFKEIGVRTKTTICIAYMDDIVNPKILKELENRLNKIDIEGVFSTGTMQELIRDNPMSPFNTIGNTERPDVVASKLLQGRIAILCEGSPTVLTLPYLFIEQFQVNEDYYDNFIYASVNRILRIIAFILTITIPAIYVAFTTFHKEMIPIKLAFSIYLAREGVPLPTSIEAILMVITFEIIREAGIRLPKHIGSTVSIVGALVLGDAAVNAKFVSAPIVIVAAIAGISELVLYELRTAIVIWRFIFLILASILGLYGVIFAGMALVIQLMSIKTFGIPYMLKLIDLDKYNIVDATIRAPWWLLKYRTKFISKDRVRLKDYIKRRKRK